MDLKSVDLGLGCVSFHSGWELVEWVPKSVDLGKNYVEILKICDEFWEEEPEVFRPQIELNLENSSDIGEPPVEVAGVAPTVEVEDQSSVEVLKAKASMEKDAGSKAEGTRAKPVHESVVERTGLANSLPNQPANHTVWLLKGL